MQAILICFNGKKCFENSEFNRDATLHIDLLQDITEREEQDDDIVLMHINFCETIQNSVVTFSNTLAKSYVQKNEILTGD